MARDKHSDKRGKDKREGPRAELGETFDVLKRYVLQETLGPLRGVVRVLIFGVAGALVLGVGLVLLDVAVLRALQEETGRTFAGHWNFAPYLLALAAALFGVAFLVTAAVRGGSARRRREQRARGGEAVVR